MNKNYLLNFGDSWSHAADAGREYGFSKLIAAELNLSWQDYSVPSSSVPRMVLELQNFLEVGYDPECNYTALFFVTAQERQLLFDSNGDPREMHVNDDRSYYAEYYNHRLGNFTLNTSIITLQSICRRYKINDHYLLGWQLPVLWPGVDVKKFYNNGQSNAVDMFDSNKKDLYELIRQAHPCLRSDGHPSIEGHRQIAKHWIKWIQPDVQT